MSAPVDKAHGIILRTRVLTESSLIVQWLTEQYGRISTVAKGVRKTKSTLHGKLDLFYEADLSFGRSRTSELHTLREARLKETNASLRQDLDSLQQASYGVHLLELATETETPLPGLYELFLSFVHAVGKIGPRKLFVLSMELKMLRELGLEPDAGTVSFQNDTRQLIAELSNASWEQLCELELNPETSGETNHFLHGYLIYHLGRLPRGRAEALNSK